MVYKNCDYKKNTFKGICKLENASDGLPIRCVGHWAKDKYFYLGRYFEIFSSAMKDKWKGELYYIDLFAGCGKCRVRDTEEEIDGSALMALSVKYLFKKYFLVELDPSAARTLEKRIEQLPSRDRVHIIKGDCNKKIDEIISRIPENSLSLAIIDPTGLHIRFDTLQQLTKDRRIDLVITFPEGMDIKRNLSRYIKQQHSILDDYIGDREWRNLFTKDIGNIDQLTSAHIERNLIDYYRKKLGKLDYCEIKSADEILIRSSQKKLPLYYLLFASKHRLGHKFWKEISKVSPKGQLKLSLNNDSNDFLRESPTAYISSKPKLVYKDYKLLDERIVNLVERVNDGSIITRFNKTPLPESSSDVVCPHFLELKWAYGCPFDCAWCYLKGTFRFQPEGTSPKFKPLEKVKSHVDAFLAGGEIPEILNAGEIADSLMGEGNGYPFSKFIIPIFESQRRHKVLFVTKSAAIKHLLDIPVSRQVVISFSLNAEEVAKKWEKKAPPVKSRIEAAQKLYNHGYEVRIRIDPMVPMKNWEKFYVQLIDQLFNSFLPERVTLGSLRGLQSTINGVKDNSWVKYLSESSNWGKKVDFDLRAAMYGKIISYLTRKYNYSNVALCKETVALWNELGLSYKKIRCNCVW